MTSKLDETDRTIGKKGHVLTTLLSIQCNYLLVKWWL